MADIRDVQVVKWANERSRTIADKGAALYAALVAYQNEYAAQGIAAKIVSAGASGTVADGSDVDGRPRITGTTLVNFKAVVDQMKTAFDATVAGVGSPATTTINQIQVNGSPR
jgi:hypothetical protein